MAALADAAIIMQPEMLVDEDLKAGRLLPVLEDFEPPAMPLSLLYLRGRHVPPKMRAFVDFAVARFRSA